MLTPDLEDILFNLDEYADVYPKHGRPIKGLAQAVADKYVKFKLTGWTPGWNNPKPLGKYILTQKGKLKKKELSQRYG